MAKKFQKIRKGHRLGMIMDEKDTRDYRVKDGEDIVFESVLPPEKGELVSTKECLSKVSDVCMLEWALVYPTMKPKQYLREVRGYSEKEVQSLIRAAPVALWEARREDLRNKATEKVLTRHIDQLAEMNDSHIRASRLLLAKSLKALSELGEAVVDPKTGKPKFTKSGYPVVKFGRSIDLVNIGTAIEKAQKLFRTAMGLPNEGEGVQQILSKLAEQQRQVQQNLQINIHNHEGGEKSTTNTVASEFEKLSYDELKVFIQHKREKLREEET